MPAPARVTIDASALPARDLAPTALPGVAASSGATPATTPAATGGPQIYALSATPDVVHAGESIAFAVRTSPDVATVVAKVSSYSLPLVRTAPGRFSLAFTIPPNVPGFFHGTYSMDVIAAEKGGTSVSRSLAVTFQ